MRLLLTLTLFALSCHASCVWLRTVGDDELAWCVNKATGEEGPFTYTRRSDWGTMGIVKHHLAINRLFREQLREGLWSGTTRPAAQPSSIETPTTQNWTIYALDVLTTQVPAMFWSGVDALSSMSSTLTKAINKRRRRLHGEDVYEEMPMAMCVMWNYRLEQKPCTHRLGYGEEYMTDGQSAALTDECERICAQQDEHCEIHTRWDRLPPYLPSERKCCSCGIGEVHTKGGRRWCKA